MLSIYHTAHVNTSHELDMRRVSARFDHRLLNSGHQLAHCQTCHRLTPSELVEKESFRRHSRNPSENAATAVIL